MRYEWHYGENIYQRYYDTNVENSYLCVYENKWNPGVWLGMYDGISLHNKTRNDRVRKKNKDYRRDAVFLNCVGIIF